VHNGASLNNRRFVVHADIHAMSRRWLKNPQSASEAIDQHRTISRNRE
jgi:hypothetical protein